jgi:hypothetical protein
MTRRCERCCCLVGVGRGKESNAEINAQQSLKF